MEHSESYGGHDIDVWTAETPAGTFLWHYTIDGGFVTSCEGAPHPSEELACKEGVQEARSRVETWKRQQ
jgi:hypothetical protein